MGAPLSLTHPPSRPCLQICPVHLHSPALLHSHFQFFEPILSHIHPTGARPALSARQSGVLCHAPRHPGVLRGVPSHSVPVRVDPHVRRGPDWGSTQEDHGQTRLRVSLHGSGCVLRCTLYTDIHPHPLHERRWHPEYRGGSLPVAVQRGSGFLHVPVHSQNAPAVWRSAPIGYIVIIRLLLQILRSKFAQNECLR